MKRDERVPFMLSIFHYFPWEPFQSIHRENKFREVLNKDPVTKISSTEFAVFGPALPEYSFRKNFCPQGDRTARINCFTVICKAFYQLSKTTNNHLYAYDYNH